MNLKRIPLIPTLLVLAAAGAMVGLGFWQLDRLHQKEALLAQYAAAQTNPAVSDWPEAGAGTAASRLAMNYRRVRATCTKVLGTSATAGYNARGESGWRYLASCSLAGGDGRAEVVLGWSRETQSPAWPGGHVEGTLVLTGPDGARIFADPPLAGLEPNARPDPKDIPNNHLSYAIQWFLFAATALVIYALALRKRMVAA